jgi:hypothetical protein|tara:strand:- start:283 stop:456 length:174 start_codon:yes stop_codon:yes gene_type:complete
MKKKKDKIIRKDEVGTLKKALIKVSEKDLKEALIPDEPADTEILVNFYEIEIPKIKK